MHFKEALSVLSKASPFAVKTNMEADMSLKEFKEYLYIPSDIEKDFHLSLQNINGTTPKIIFLCGSSGDGKSEILTRYQGNYFQNIDFHFDGTHSDHPEKDAIHTLDARFSAYKATARSLVVGINLGMLGNYTQDGSNDHSDIKNAIRAFLEGKNTPEDCTAYTFLHFENYPKFSFDSATQTVNSEFAHNILRQLTKQSEENPFYRLYQQEIKEYRQEEDSTSFKILSNYMLLSEDGVQAVIIELLFKAHAFKGQFLTARTLLDFIYHIVCSEQYIFDALFLGGDNELLDKIKTFDPAACRSPELDNFVIQVAMQKTEEDFIDFKKTLQKLYIADLESASSYMRVFSLLRRVTIGNNYHKKFENVFEDNIVKEYITLWNLHNVSSTDSNSKKKLDFFYKAVLIGGIRKYINRAKPSLTFKKNIYLVSELNNSSVLTELPIECSPQRKDFKRTYFTVNLSVNNLKLKPLLLSITFFELLLKLEQGYQPSKSDSASILLLDEVAEQILSIAKGQEKLIFADSQSEYDIVDEGDYISVEDRNDESY